MRGRFQGWVGRAALLTLIAGSAAGCSADASRFGENPFSNPFAGKPDTPAATGALAPRGAPVGGVRSASLAPPRQAMPPKVTSSPSAGIGQAGNWTSQGGTPVTIGQGESVMTLADRYGVPPQALLSANGLTSASQAQPGQQIIIPVFQGGKSAAAAPVAAAAPKVLPPVAPAREKLAWKKGATVPKDDDDEDEKPAKRPVAPQAAKKDAAVKKSVVAKKAADDEDDDDAPVKPAPNVAEKPAEKPAAKIAAKPAPKVASLAPVAPQQQAKQAIVRPEPEPAQTGSIPPKVDTAPAAPATDFRWPAKGRVIGAYSKGANDGINISLPEGTSIRSAEGGTVAYAGSELKGYGNLVLVKHPDGYVSAYAHNGELLVKRGETVKRGQVIAKSGQSGNVSSPQLHFELRKGATPVDPTPLLQ